MKITAAWKKEVNLKTDLLLVFNCSKFKVFSFLFLRPFCRPAMIRSELRSALRRYPTEEEAGGGASVQPVGQLQSLIAQRMQRAQELLEEMRLQVRLLHP